MEELKPSVPNSTPLTPLTFLERAAIAYAESPSIIYNTTKYTWSETNQRCLRVASAITTLGIGRHNVVSVVSPNIPAMYELHFAVPMAGAILNNINTRLNTKTISLILHHSESKLVFVYQQFKSLVLDAISLLPSNHPRPLIVLITEDNLNKEVMSYEGLVNCGDPNFKWVHPTSEWDPIVLNYTSGTTAAPKGVVHCHRGMLIMSLDTLVNWSVPKQPIYLWTLPMFHANGWAFPWAMAAVGGVNICLNHFDGAKILDAIDRYHVTHMCGAPVVLKMIINTPNAGPLKRPVHVLMSGAPPPTSVLQGAEVLGFVVDHGYGLTETEGVILSCSWKPKWTTLSPKDKAKLKARQGVRTIGMTEFDVVDQITRKSVIRDGKMVGEVVFRGGSIMLGYLKNREGTSKCMGDDGWFRTRDLAVMHLDGYIEIKDRLKDVIISGGENISSIEVETVLYTFPGVNEVAVVAQPHDHWGETPCAFVSFKQGVKVKPTPREIIEYCKTNMPRYMVPKSVVFKDELPKTSTGKIQKFLLKEMARAMVMGPSKPSRL